MPHLTHPHLTPQQRAELTRIAATIRAHQQCGGCTTLLEARAAMDRALDRV